MLSCALPWCLNVSQCVSMCPNVSHTRPRTTFLWSRRFLGGVKRPKGNYARSHATFPMGFSYLGDQDTTPGNYWDSFLGPSRSPGSVLIIFLIIIIIVTARIVSHDSRQSPVGPSGAHRGERMGWGCVLQRCCMRLLTLSCGLYFTYDPRPVLP